MKIKEFELQRYWEDEGDSKNDNMEKMLSWYRRGAIRIDELAYNLIQIDKERNFEELANFLVNILEVATKAQRQKVRKELMKILLERGY